MTSSRERVVDVGALLRLLEPDRRSGKRIVFTNGCFDVLHAGHIALLEAAAAEGDRLVVGLNSDDSVRRLKGAGRPVIPEDARAWQLAALRAVDYVVLFHEDTPRSLIEVIRPDILVKGEDYPADQIIGREAVESSGGRVVRVPLHEEYSTTTILKRLAEGSR